MSSVNEHLKEKRIEEVIMTPGDIQTAIELALQNKLGPLWLLYILAFVGTAFSAFTGAYVKVKATNFATKEDFNQVLAQLKSQTTATEQIKSEISHKTWKTQEWNATRRKKLEELVSCAFQLRSIAYSDLEKLGHKLDESDNIRFNPESESLLKLEMLSSLYFPELMTYSLKLNINFRELQKEISDSNYTSKELIERASKNSLTQEDLDRLKTSESGTGLLNVKISELHQEFSKSLTSLTGKARDLFGELIES